MSSIILADRCDLQRIIKEEKKDWVYNVLIALGADKNILASNEDISEYLSLLEIEVWDNISANTVDISRKGKLVAQWKIPKFKLVKEGKNKFYYEIQLNEWALPFQMRRRVK